MTDNYDQELPKQLRLQKLHNPSQKPNILQITRDIKKSKKHFVSPDQYFS